MGGERRKRLGEVVAVAELERAEHGAGQAAEPGEHYYTPDRIDDWLSRWRELVELAQPSCGSTSYLAAEHQARRGIDTKRDPLRHCDIKADIERVWCSFNRWSIEFLVIEGLMQGWTIEGLADSWAISRRDVWAAYHQACEAMAEQLGWQKLLSRMQTY